MTGRRISHKRLYKIFLVIQTITLYLLAVLITRINTPGIKKSESAQHCEHEIVLYLFPGNSSYQRPITESIDNAPAPRTISIIERIRQVMSISYEALPGDIYTPHSSLFFHNHICDHENSKKQSNYRNNQASIKNNPPMNSNMVAVQVALTGMPSVCFVSSAVCFMEYLRNDTI